MSAGLVLASASASRAALLRQAGVAFEAVPSAVDEGAIKRGMAGRPAGEIALRLARAKAAAVARDRPDAIVIGADQMLVLGERTFDKPADRAAARAQLAALAGNTHTLETAVVVLHGGRTAWSHVARPALTMRAVGSGFLDAYLARAGDTVLASVGAYQLEGLGIQLFERIDGDYFSILGLPLLPLLAALRGMGAVPA